MCEGRVIIGVWSSLVCEGRVIIGVWSSLVCEVKGHHWCVCEVRVIIDVGV